MCDQCKDNNSGFSTGIVLGALFGAFTGYYLSTPKGREMLEDVQEKASKTINDITEKNPDIKKVQETIQEVVQQAQETAKEAKQKAKKVVEKAQDNYIQATKAEEMAEQIPQTQKAPARNFFKRAGSPLKS